MQKLHITNYKLLSIYYHVVGIKDNCGASGTLYRRCALEKIIRECCEVGEELIASDWNEVGSHAAGIP